MIIKEMFLIAKVFQRLGSGSFLLGVILRSLSKAFSTAALFLPLKILILISSSKTPEYFGFIGGWVTKEKAIFILMITTPVVYASYLILGVVSHRILKFDYESVMPDVLNMSGYEIKGRKIKWFHDHCAKGVSEAIIIAASILVISLTSHYYFAMFCAILGSYFFLMLKFLYPKDSTYKEFVFKIPFSVFVEYSSAVLYFAIFFVLVLYVSSGLIGLYGSLLALLVSRLAVQSAQKLLVELFYVDKDLKSCR